MRSATVLILAMFVGFAVSAIVQPQQQQQQQIDDNELVIVEEEGVVEKEEGGHRHRHHHRRHHHKFNKGQFFVTSQVGANCSDLAQSATILEGGIFKNLDAFNNFTTGQNVSICRRWRETSRWHHKNGTVRNGFISDDHKEGHKDHQHNNKTVAISNNNNLNNSLEQESEEEGDQLNSTRRHHHRHHHRRHHHHRHHGKFNMGQFFVASQVGSNCSELAPTATILEGGLFKNLDALNNFSSGQKVELCFRWKETSRWHERNGTIRNMFIEEYKPHHNRKHHNRHHNRNNGTTNTAEDDNEINSQ